MVLDGWRHTKWKVVAVGGGKFKRTKLKSLTAIRAFQYNLVLNHSMVMQRAENWTIQKLFYDPPLHALQIIHRCCRRAPSLSLSFLFNSPPERSRLNGCQIPNCWLLVMMTMIDCDYAEYGQCAKVQSSSKFTHNSANSMRSSRCPFVRMCLYVADGYVTLPGDKM